MTPPEVADGVVEAMDNGGVFVFGDGMTHARTLASIASSIVALSLSSACGTGAGAVSTDGGAGDARVVVMDAMDGRAGDARADHEAEVRDAGMDRSARDVGADTNQPPPAPDAAHDAHSMSLDGGVRDTGTDVGVSDSGTGRCTTASDCASKGPCVTVTCDVASGMCVDTNVPDGTPTPMFTQVTGDCVIHECENGADSAQPDPIDLPAAVNDCGDPSCAGGVPSQSYAQHVAGSPCSTYMGNHAGFCDGMGACDQCRTDGECVGATTDCQHPSCSTGACTTTNVAAGTATMTDPPQIAADCQTIECDGMGGTKTVPDEADVPFTGTVCLTGVCTNGTPSKTINVGLMCAGTAANPELCDAKGACGCQSNADCVLPQTCSGGGTTLVCGCTPLTCARETPPATCGTVSDGCGGQLPCNDGVKDGSETDVDCGGGTTMTSSCTNLCAQGKQCNASSDCANGLTCADGVCCNTACGSSCEACTAAKKGQGADGVCGAVLAGRPDPKGQCTSQPASTCGDEGGQCNGAGGCAVWASGTVCQAASCAGPTAIAADTCVAGACTAPVPASINCAPYECVAGTCTKTCNVDTDCASAVTDYCNAHVCTARLTNGSACNAAVEASQCLSNNCVDGFCCNSACTSQCQACSNALTGNANGVCTTVVAGVPDPSHTCAVATPSTCGTNGLCAANGACQDYSPATACGPTGPSCTGGVATMPGSCSGNGSCNDTVSCSPYVCGATTCLTACGAQITGDASCVPGDYCDGVGPGVCRPKESHGVACTFGDQCTSGVCTAGFCN